MVVYYYYFYGLCFLSAYNLPAMFYDKLAFTYLSTVTSQRWKHRLKRAHSSANRKIFGPSLP